ncbi:MAG: ATP phosphoribosyltransferase regulatory subunit, partial [Ruminococcus sp.]|nr:ATP phosphoribosyltransferase regulatory subunit [Ruminococcus sp.]
MKRYLKITPEGTKDFLFAECAAMDDVCGRIETVFAGRGFKRVITPGIEFYDVFSLPCSGIAQEDMFKTTDNKGRLMVVRPDSTLP